MSDERTKVREPILQKAIVELHFVVSPIGLQKIVVSLLSTPASSIEFHSLRSRVCLCMVHCPCAGIDLGAWKLFSMAMDKGLTCRPIEIIASRRCGLGSCKTQRMKKTGRSGIFFPVIM